MGWQEIDHQTFTSWATVWIQIDGNCAEVRGGAQIGHGVVSIDGEEIRNATHWRAD